MKKPCGNTHPLYNPGSVQSGRKPHLLGPEKVVYEDRTVSDWLVYLSKYAKHINYFGLNDQEVASEDWSSFFNQDVSVLLAKIAEEQAAQIQTETNALLYSLQHDDLTDLEAKKKFTLLFGQVLNIVFRLNSYSSNLEKTAALKKDIERRVITVFEIRLKRLIAYLKEAKNQSLFDVDTDNNLPDGGQAILGIQNWPLSKMWFSTNSAQTWSDYYNAISADDSPYLSNVLNPTSAQAKLNLAARYQLLVESLKGVVSGFAGIISSARKEFDVTITDWPSHQPDRALLLSFLKLLELYSKELNTFNKRHLDHHLKDILQLKPAVAKPDQVFLVAELAKTKEQALLKKGTEISGGKDADGRELLYALNEDVVVNKARVVAKKGVLKTNGKIIAPQSLATADGLEEELEFPEEGWDAFGKADMPEAQLGFAVASDVLAMKDGTRRINVIITITDEKVFNRSKVLDVVTRLKMRVTGEEGWLSLVVKQYILDPAETKLTLKGELGADEPAIVPFDNQLHGELGYISQPVVEVYIASEDHAYLQEFNVKNVSVEVDVVDSKHASVSTTQGEVDTSKPFVAFGSVPAKSNAVVIGAQEMLSKPLTSLIIRTKWSSPGDDERSSGDFTADNGTLLFQQLKGGEWIDKTAEITTSNGSAVYTWSGVDTNNNIETESFGPKSTRGFIRFALSTDLAHKGYPNELSTRMAEIAVNGLAENEDPNIPLPYQTPTIERLTIDYIAQSTVLELAESKNYNPEKTRFYHITPFGTYEASGNMLGVTNPPLVPKYEDEGECYIGLENAQNGQRINLLIHVLEGSAHPLRAKQDITWQLLDNNKWVDFESGGLVDGTNGLIKTGIVSLSIPFKFKTSGSYFSDDYVWIRATIKQHADAVCKIIDVFAQGLSATLSSIGHSTLHYKTALPAESATKLKRSNPSLKKILQPVESKGGKAPETDDNFYTRISERLRHKDRGITLWDYERLVLQEFPQLSMCKALTHTKYAINEDDELEYSESSPGNVAIVCVPVKTELFKPAQKPFTPVDTLEEVKTFLGLKMPPWSTLHVKNPIFEEVQVDARVEFNSDIQDTDYYLEVLNGELKELFSPWRTDQARGLRFNWRIHKSHVIDFIDERPYINYVRDVKINLSYGPDEEDGKEDVEEAIPRYAVSVLISSPTHALNLVP